MPILTSISANGRGLIQEDTGVVTANDILNHLRQLLNAGRGFMRLDFSLVDLTGVSIMDVSSDQWRSIASVDLQLAALNPRLVVAVAASSDVVFGLIRMWQVFVEATGWTVEVFRSRLEAEEWLQIRVPSFSLDLEQRAESGYR
jgi:hypothetical protein